MFTIAAGVTLPWSARAEDTRPAQSQTHVSPIPIEPARAALPECQRGARPSPCVQPKDAYRHDGFFLTFGWNFDYLSYFGTGPRGDASVSDFASGFLLAIGGTPARGLVLGGAFRFSSTRDDFQGAPREPEGYATISVGYLGPFVIWYPNPNTGWHLGASLGLGMPSILDSQVKDAGGFAVSGTVLGGYSWWVGPQWSLDLRAAISATPASSMTTSDGDDTRYRFRTLAAGSSCGITFH